MKKPPFIKLYVKDFAFDIQGKSNSAIGKYIKEFIKSYQTGEISNEFEEDSLFFELKKSTNSYKSVCETNRNNRLKSDASSNDSSTNGQRMVNDPLTKNQEPELEPELEPIKKKEYTSSFEDFWKAYPHKIGKKDAFVKYKIALKTAKQEELVSGVDRYKENKPKDVAYCNPATWLHQERWLDEPDGCGGKVVKLDKNLYDFNGDFKAYQKYINERTGTR